MLNIELLEKLQALEDQEYHSQIYPGDAQDQPDAARWQSKKFIWDLKIQVTGLAVSATLCIIELPLADMDPSWRSSL